MIDLEELVYNEKCINCPRAKYCHEEVWYCDEFEERLQELEEEMEEENDK